jgi:hypothetical protein
MPSNASVAINLFRTWLEVSMPLPPAGPIVIFVKFKGLNSVEMWQF